MFAFALWDTRRAHADAGPRPARREAALLRLAGRRARFLFGSELKALRAHPGVRGRRSTATRWRCFMRHNYVPAPLLDLPGHPQAAAGHASSTVSRRERDSRGSSAYWSAARRSRAAAPAQPLRRRPERGGRRARTPAARRGRPADGRRRAARRVPVGRDRFLDRRRADAGAIAAAGADVHDRLRRGRLQRGRRTPRRSPRISAPTTPSCMSPPTRRWASFPSCPRSTTSRSPIRRRSRPSWSRSWRAST